MYLIKSFNEPP